MKFDLDIMSSNQNQRGVWWSKFDDIPSNGYATTQMNAVVSPPSMVGRYRFLKIVQLQYRYTR